MFQRISNRLVALLCAMVAVIFPVVTVAHASTTVSYNFDTAGDLVAGFTGYVSSGTVSQTLTGGINNSGAINAPGSADAVYSSKETYSLGPVGSTYTFSSYLQSVGNSGYSGMGFTTAATPSSANSSGGPFRPRDALGISVHGGGFVFHKGNTDVSGNWNTDNSGITTVTRATISDLLNSGSPSKWYKIILNITRDSSTTFDMRVEVWSSDATGALLRPNAADAIFELRDVTNSTLTSAASINTYINFSGDRVRYFDGYTVDLAGGSSVIQAGAPVVLTSSVTNTANDVLLSGNVTGNGGSTVTERGFVYSLAHDPTTADTKIISGSGTGVFTGNAASLSNGTYFFRAYATNATGTSYGAEQSLALTSAVLTQAASWVPSVTTATTNVTTLTPSTGASTSGTGTISYAVNSQGGSGCTVDASNPPVISFGAAGTCVVRATAAANSTYSSAYADVSFTITSPQAQVITWAPTNTAALVTASPITPDVVAVSSGTGAISYSVQSAGTTSCNVNSSTGVVTALAAGTCVVRATAASDATFAVATTDVSFEIGSTITSLELEIDLPAGNSVENAPVNYSTTGLQPGSIWDVVLRSSPQTLASGNVGSSGVIAGTNSIPSGLEPGWHSLTFTGTSLLGSSVATTVWFQVDQNGVLVSTQSTTPSELTGESLPNTGSSTYSFLLFALSLLTVGFAFAAVNRIRVTKR